MKLRYINTFTASVFALAAKLKVLAKKSHSKLSPVLIFLAVMSISPITNAFDPDAPKEAYACDNCNLSQARQLALLQAPINTCSIWDFGSPAMFCEPISKEVIIASNETETAYKFTVTTDIDSQNNPSVSIFSWTLNATENALVDEYFLFNRTFANAVVSAQEELAIYSSSSVGKPPELNITSSRTMP